MQVINQLRKDQTRLNSYQQWEFLALKAREMKLDVEMDWVCKGYRIGKKRYHSHIDASCALLAAFDQLKVKLPDMVRERPIDLL